jgi:hypothetical protein
MRHQQEAAGADAAALVAHLDFEPSLQQVSRFVDGLCT